MECLNCGKEFAQTDNYCKSCGQKTDSGRLTTSHAVHQFFHSFTHTDKSFLSLIPKLLTEPGIISREYNEGKRKTYFSPFSFVLIIVALSTILVSNFQFMSIPYQSGKQIPEVEIVTRFTNTHFNLMVFFSIPLIGWFTTLFFRKRINFAESLVLVSYTSGERSIFFMLIVIPLTLIFKEYYFLIVYPYLFLFMIYYSWACCQYFNNYRIGTWIKGALSFVFSQLAVTFVITIVITILVMLR